MNHDRELTEAGAEIAAAEGNPVIVFSGAPGSGKTPYRTLAEVAESDEPLLNPVRLPGAAEFRAPGLPLIADDAPEQAVATPEFGMRTDQVLGDWLGLDCAAVPTCVAAAWPEGRNKKTGPYAGTHGNSE